LLFFGGGSILGGYLSGYLCDRYHIKISGYLGNLFIIVACLVEVYFLSVEATLVGTSIVGFFSGVSYSFLFSYLMIVCTIYYGGSAFSFAVIRFVHVIFYIIYQWLVVIINNAINMKINMIYQSLVLIPMAIFAAYCMKIECR
jgi:hypothetical protein